MHFTVIQHWIQFLSCRLKTSQIWREKCDPAQTEGNGEKRFSICFQEFQLAIQRNFFLEVKRKQCVLHPTGQNYWRQRFLCHDFNRMEFCCIQCLRTVRSHHLPNDPSLRLLSHEQGSLFKQLWKKQAGRSAFSRTRSAFSQFYSLKIRRSANWM